MATDGGPNIERDGLVFGMDTGYGVANNSTETRFYKGEPTTNLKSSTQTSGAINGMSGVSVTYVGEEDGWKKYSLSGTFSNGTYPYCMYLSSQQCLAGMRYSTQVIIKTNVRDKFNYFATNGVSYVNQPKNHEGVNSSTLLSDGSQLLQRQGFEYTSTTTQAGYLWTNPINNTTFNPSTDFVYIKDFQIEQKIHCTPFVSDEREETKSLIDLTKTTDIDVSNVSFDSTGQPTFDGTNDYASIGNPTALRDLASGTIEAVYYRDASTGTYQMIFTDSGSKLEITYSGNVLQFYIGNSGLSVTHAVTGQFFHVVGTWGPGYKKLYLDGSEIASGTNTGVDTGSISRYIGGRGTSFPFNGKVPLVKVYTKALSTAEVTQNYNAYKNRFNL
jgi:hypothetical protein